MKAPNPTFLHKAENIRGKRRFVTLILVLILSVLVLVVAFVMAVAARQREYAELYPVLRCRTGMEISMTGGIAVLPIRFLGILALTRCFQNPLPKVSLLLN